MMSTRAVVIALVSWLACAPLALAQSQSWDKVLPASRRFVVLETFGGEAVLDKETGLVWERKPGDASGDGVVNEADVRTWYVALHYCRTTTAGNRKGWRLPTVVELETLIDPSVSLPFPIPSLPEGHPFSLTIDTFPDFWSSSSYASDPTNAHVLPISTGQHYVVNKELGRKLVWCVRGGSGVDPQ